MAKTNPTTQAYAELQSAWVHYNRELFGGKLPPCLITMQREKRTYGYFSSQRFVHRHDKSKTDEIAINPSYFAVVPLLEILQTLVHEMTHQWQSHFGEPGRRTYHNREWSEKMENIGLMPSSTGQPGGAKTGEKMADYPIAGGAFMKATDALLKKDFAVSWLDRMPPAGPLGAAAGGRLSDLAQTLGALLTPSPAGNRSNRVKFRCPSCAAQLWGKPSLRVLCGGQKCRRAAFEPVA